MKNLKNRKLILLLAIAAAMAVAVGGTIAYLVDQTESLVNTFTPTSVDVTITDNVSGVVKSNVIITNTGSTSAYIRARIVGNWVDNQTGQIVQKWNDASTANGGDGDFADLPGDGWQKSGDYYYYKFPVAPDQPTGNPLFTSYTVTKSVEGAHLVMDILVQAIQSEGVNANGERPVQAAWGVYPPDLP